MSIEQIVAGIAEPLPPVDADDFADVFARFADRKVVLLGEATHGTSEFYRARAAITRRLVERYGFTSVAVEADWPDAAIINRAARGIEPLRGQEPPFQRFPRWMWRNKEMAEFFGWLRRYNSAAGDTGGKAGFYGLDLYNLTGAIASVLAYLDKMDPQAAAIARERYGCLTPWQRDPAAYARATVTAGYKNCEEEVIAQCKELLAKRISFSAGDGESFLDAAQSAKLIASAEEYYRTMYYGGGASWNLRDTHIFATLRGILTSVGGDAKAVVWAHNSHVGDARETEMGRTRNELSLGQLCREHYGQKAVLIGFGTHQGTVAAANAWGDPVQIVPVRPSIKESWEGVCHEASAPRALLDFNQPSTITQQLAHPRQQRFIGVVYRPQTERMSHYLEASIVRQYDGYVWLDETSAVAPLDDRNGGGGFSDTYPFGM